MALFLVKDLFRPTFSSLREIVKNTLVFVTNTWIKLETPVNLTPWKQAFHIVYNGFILAKTAQPGDIHFSKLVVGYSHNNTAIGVFLQRINHSDLVFMKSFLSIRPWVIDINSQTVFGQTRK